MSFTLRPEIKGLLWRMFRYTLLSLAGLTAVTYVIDYAVFRYRVSTNRQPYGQYTVYSYDAVPQKSGKTEFIFNDPAVQVCVHAMFPHAGYVPCWYLQKHTEPRTNM